MEQYYTATIKIQIYASEPIEAEDKLYKVLEESELGADIELMKVGIFKPDKEESEEINDYPNEDWDRERCLFK